MKTGQPTATEAEGAAKRQPGSQNRTPAADPAGLDAVKAHAASLRPYGATGSGETPPRHGPAPEPLRLPTEPAHGPRRAEARDPHPADPTPPRRPSPAPRRLEAELADPGPLAAGAEELRLLRNLYLALRRNTLAILGVAFAAAILAYVLSYTIEPKYRAGSRVMLDTRIVADPTYTPVVSGLPTTLTSLESELEVLRSTDLIERVVVQMGLDRQADFLTPTGSALPGLSDVKAGLRALLPTGDDASAGDAAPALTPVEAAIAVIADARTIEQVGTTSAVYQINVTLPDRILAAEVANALAEEYLDTQRMEKLRALERSQGWLAERTTQLQETLSDFSAELEAHDIEAPLSEEEYETIRAQRTNVTRQLTSLAERNAEAEAALSVAQRALSAGDMAGAAAAVGLVPVEGQTPDALRPAIDTAVTRLSDRLSAADAERQVLEAQLARLRDLQEQQAAHDAETRRIENEITVIEAIYRDFVAQLSRRTEQDEYLDADGRIIEYARAPLDPAEPRRSSAAAGAFLLTAILGALAVFLHEIGHRRMRTLGELSRAIGLPVAGALAEVRGRHGSLPATLVAGLEPLPRGPALRHAKRLAAALDARLPLAEGRATVIAGTSALAGEGQSTALLLIAAAWAQVGERVLLLDADLQASAYRTRDGNRGSQGDAGQDANAVGRLDRVLRIDTVPGLFILTSGGGGDAAPLPLSAAELAEALDDLRGSFDRILIDTPPLIPGIESLSLLRRADAVVMFARWNSTPTRAAQNVMGTLREAGVEPIFAVATRVDLRKIASFGDAAMPYAREEARIAD